LTFSIPKIPAVLRKMDFFNSHAWFRQLWKHREIERRFVRMTTRTRNLLTGSAFILLLMLTASHFLAVTSGAYKLAVATAQQRAEFNDELGPPVREAWFSGGKTQFGKRAKADLLVPVQGSKRKGSLRVLAIKDQENWKLKELTLELAQPEKRIDLLWNPLTGDYSKRLVDQLIDDLTQIDSQSPGINSAAVYEGFIADNTPGSFQMGVLGPPPPKVPPQMSELVRRGPPALPELIKHLDDRRPTKFEVGNKPSGKQIGVGAFMFMDFSDEYDPRVPHWFDGSTMKNGNAVLGDGKGFQWHVHGEDCGRLLRADWPNREPTIARGALSAEWGTNSELAH
jgi:hypothetical protein